MRHRLLPPAHALVALWKRCHLSPDSQKTAALVGLAFSAFLTVVLLRGLLFSKGFVGFEDAVFNQDMFWNRDIHLYAWRQLVGTDGFRYLLTFPLFIPAYVFGNSGLFSKFLLFTVFVLVGAICFAVVFAWLREKRATVPQAYAGALVGTLTYVLNPMTTVLMYDFISLFSYAFLPLTYWLTRSALRQTSLSVSRALKFAILISLVLIAASTMYHMFTLHLIVGAITALSEIMPRLIAERRRPQRYLLYCSGLAAGTVLFFFLLWAYYAWPNLIMQSLDKSEYRHSFISAAHVIEFSARAQWYNVIRGFGFGGDWGGMYDCGGAFRTLWSMTTVLVPVLAFGAIVARFKSRDVLTLAVVLLAGIFLAKGPNWPLGDAYLWLFSHFELPFTTGGLYYSIRARPLIFLPYAFLSGLAMVHILGAISTWTSATLPVAEPGRCARLRTWFRNRLSGKWSGSPLAGKWLSAAALLLACCAICIGSFPLFSGDERGAMTPIVLPQPYQEMNDWLNTDNGDYRVAWLPPSDAPAWNPHRDSADRWGSVHLNYLPARLTSKPLTSESGMGTWGNWPAERDRLEQYIYLMLGAGLSSFTGELLAIENCKYVVYHDDTVDRKKFSKLIGRLEEADELKEVYRRDYIRIYENEAYQPYVRMQDKAVLVIGGIDCLGLLTTTGLDVPNSRSALFLEQKAPGDEQLEDILRYTDFIVIYGNKSMDDFVLSSVGTQYYHPALDCWTNDYRSPWTRDFFYASSWLNAVSSGPGNPWDFDLGLGMMRTEDRNAALDFTVDTDEAPYEVWVRNFVGYEGNTMQASVDGQIMATINSWSYITTGFQWQRIGKMDLKKGQHHVVLKTNDSGFNAVNAIAVVPAQTLQNHRDRLNNWIRDSNITVVPANDALYRVSATPGEAKGEVVAWNRLGRTQLRVTVRVSEPCILSFGESYNRSWIATDGESRLPKVILNSVANGFLLERTGTYDITLEFEMENHLRTGKIISGVTCGLLLGTLAFIVWRERRTGTRHGKDPAELGGTTDGPKS